MSLKKKFLCIGSISFDLIFQVDRMPLAHEKLRCPTVHQSCGGSAANTAWWLARLGHEVQFVGSVGKDAFGLACAEHLKSAGINIDGIQYVDDATGVATVFTNSSEKRMVTSAGANRYLDPALVDLECIEPGDFVHLSVSDDRKAIFLMTQAAVRGATVSCEFNGNRNAERLDCIDYAFMNHDELSRWMGTENVIDAWQKMSGATKAALAVTSGADGAAFVRGGEILRVPAGPVSVVDRTGGGDAFDAGFLHAVAVNRSPNDALATGLALAALCISHHGAMPFDVTDRMLAELPIPAFD